MDHRAVVPRAVCFLLAALSVASPAQEPSLMGAVASGQLSQVQALLDAGVDVDARGKNGATALMLAALLGHTDIVTALLKKGADVNARDDSGETALMRGAWRGRREVAHVLLAGGADVNARDKAGRTALHMATALSMDPSPALVRLLLARGADPNVKDGKGSSLLADVLVAAGLARSGAWRERSTSVKTHMDIVQVLLDAGVRVNMDVAWFLSKPLPEILQLFKLKEAETRGLARSVALYRRACDGGDSSGCYGLAIMYGKGKGATRDLKRAAAVFNQGCQLSRWDCSEGAGGPRDTLGPDPYKVACYGGDRTACQHLAKLYTKACDEGLTQGCKELAILRREEAATTQDWTPAAVAQRRACLVGVAKDCAQVGLRHLTGDGVPLDAARGEAFLTRACDQDNALGCAALAWISK